MLGIRNEWSPVQLLIAEIYQAQQSAKYPASVVRQWDSTIQFFRYIERASFSNKAPPNRSQDA